MKRWNGQLMTARVVPPVSLGYAAERAATKSSGVPETDYVKNLRATLEVRWSRNEMIGLEKKGLKNPNLIADEMLKILCRVDCMTVSGLRADLGIMNSVANAAARLLVKRGVATVWLQNRTRMIGRLK